MSLQTVVFTACDYIGIPRPSAVYGNADDSARQLLALANEEGNELAGRYQWEALIKEASFVATNTETQGSILTIAGPDFGSVVSSTMWNRSNMRPVYGGLSPQVWQTLKASNVTGPYPQYRIRGGTLLMIPSPASGNEYFFEYYSKNWCVDSSGTAASAWLSDQATSLLDESIMAQGVRWRYLRAKGLDYDEEHKTYLDSVNDAISRDGGKPVLNMGTATFYPPAPLTPEGSWNI